MDVPKIFLTAVLAGLCVLGGCATTDKPAPIAELSGTDLANGAQVYQKCTSCHKDAYHAIGPKLKGVFGQPACRQPDYQCSEALKASGIIWDYASLDRFIANPADAVQGNKMTFLGVRDTKDRRDLIAYIKAWPRKKADYAY